MTVDGDVPVGNVSSDWFYNKKQKEQSTDTGKPNNSMENDTPRICI